MSEIKFGILGCGNIARKSVIPAILQSPNCELAAIASRNREKAEELKKIYRCKTVTGYKKLLSDKDIDAVYIGTPNGTHAKWVNAALSHGKHVLCEKTLGIDFDETQIMVQSSIRHDVALREGFSYIYHPQHKFIKTLIKKGEIGEPRLFNAWFGFPPIDSSHRYSKKMGGGALLDAGTYTLHAARHFFDYEPVDVFSILDNGDQQVDIQGSILLNFKKGKSAHLAFGFSNMYRNSYSIWGSEGIITLNRAFTIPPDFPPLIKLERQGQQEEFKLEPYDQFLGELDAFCLGLNSTTTKNQWREDAIRQAKLIQKVKDASTMSYSDD